MRRPLSPSSGGLSDHAYVELVRSLFSMLLPSVVMSVLFAGTVGLAVAVTRDPVLLGLGALGLAASAVRLAVVIRVRRRGVDRAVADRNAAARHERVFGLAYASFAAILGLFAARAMTLAPADLHMIVAALVVGYAAGAAAGVSSRPRIGGGSMALAVIPPALVCLAAATTFPVALAVILLALLAGGSQNLVARYRAEVEKIEVGRAISGLARRDHLTGLPNRLGLAERFQEAVASHGDDCLVAVHCIDLDRFKPVNDQHGHPVGDALLRLVAGRLGTSLRQGDLACRFGGDEFVVLQGGLRHADEADLLARRLARVLGEPYAVGGHLVSIGASVGYVVSRCDESLDELLARADNALYAIKALGGGAAGHSDLTVGKAALRG